MATELNQNESKFPNDYEFPVCGGWCEGPNRCMKIGGSKHLNAGCYSYSAALKNGQVPNYPYNQVPKHPCIWHKNCGKYLHSPMCSAIELVGEMMEDKEKWLCITCHDQTRSKNNNKKKKNKRTPSRKRKHKAGETSQQHDKDFAAAFGDVRTGNGTDSAAASTAANDDSNNTENAGRDSSTVTAKVIPSVATSINKKTKKKKHLTKDRHHSNMRRFMDHKHNNSKPDLYTKESTWTNEQMYAITNEDVARYMKLRAYNDADADPEMLRPTYCRWETLSAIKKGISYYHPDKDAEWSIRRSEGNPTRSVVVRELMKRVLLDEVAGNGAESKERGPFVEQEYEQAIDLMEVNDDAEERLFTSGIFRMQYNLGGRIDDVSKQKRVNLVANKDIQHENLSVITKLNWSKNVRTKKQAPWQILIGAKDRHYCVLIGLAMWLEFMIVYGRDKDCEFVWGYRGSNDVDSIRHKASQIMKQVINDPEFDIVLDEKKGTHSMRKFATDFVKRNGIHKDDIDHRFRWRSKRMQDNYASTTIPSTDAKVAAALCKGGPIHYHLKEYSGINDEWVCDKVCPNITATYGSVIGKVLGRALLWCVYDTEQTKVVPIFMVDRIKEAYNEVTDKRLADGENPVEKVPLYVSGDTNGNLILEPMIEGVNEDIPQNETKEQELERLRKRYDGKTLEQRAVVQRTSGEQIDRLGSNIAGLDRRMNTMEGNAERRHEVMMQRQDRQDALIRQLLSQPYRVLGQKGRSGGDVLPHLPHHDDRTLRLAAANSAAVAAAEASRSLASLTDNPRCLHTLWHEYNEGLGGKKAAKLFTNRERGRDRSRYSKRLVFWKKIDQMVRAGHTSTDAVNKVINHYGTNLSVTKTISKMTKDQKEGTYPAILN